MYIVHKRIKLKYIWIAFIYLGMNTFCKTNTELYAKIKLIYDHILTQATHDGERWATWTLYSGEPT